MAENKKSFVLYVDQKTTFDALTEEQAGRLIKHIYSYVNDENPTLEDPLLNIAFLPIKQQLKRDLKRWEQKQEQRREAGRRSAESRKTKANETERNSTTVNDRKQTSTVNENVNGNGNVTVNGNGSSKEDIKTNTISSSVPAEEDVYITKKKRVLAGKRLEAFNTFWEKFNYRKGKAEAADAFIDIPKLTKSICDQIFKAAEIEAKNRDLMIKAGKTPKMAQGWISGRRWEDEIQPDEPNNDNLKTLNHSIGAKVPVIGKGGW